MIDPDWLGFVCASGPTRWAVQIPNDDEPGTFAIVDAFGVRFPDNGEGWAEAWECLPIDEVPDRILRGSLCAVFVNACAAMGVTFSCPLCNRPSSFPGVECVACAARPLPPAGIGR